MTRPQLVTGVAGQDGTLLARLLLARGERVVGTVTPGSDGGQSPYLSGVEIAELDVRDTDGFAALVARVDPAAVHNLAAHSSVGRSWDDPEGTDAVNHAAVVGMLEVLRGQDVRFVQASSSEIFGPVEAGVADESTPLNPTSPYAEAKARAHRAVAASREAGLAATNLVLFGHTSALHAPTFVLPSITRQAAAVALGRGDGVELRDPTVARDWGAAVDHVRAFTLALDGPPGDYVIATGELHQLADVARWALAAAGVSGSVGVASGEAARRNDFGGVRGLSARAVRSLGWRPSVTLQQTVEHMVSVDLARLRTGVEESVDYLPEP